MQEGYQSQKKSPLLNDYTPHDTVNSVQNDKYVSPYTVNLSSLPLSTSQLVLLDRGLTYIPKISHIPVIDIYSSQERLIRRLKLHDYFGDDDDDDYDPKQKRFLNPSRWTPADHKLQSSTLDTIQTMVNATEAFLNGRRITDRRLVQLKRTPDNLTDSERQALRQLGRESSIVIKPADKGSATVIMDKKAYEIEAYRQLQNSSFYRQLPSPIYTNNVQRINSILDEMIADNVISKGQHLHLRAKTTDRQRVFYLLPKIHKPRSKWPQPDRMPEGRPIVSDSDSESYRISQFVESFIRPLSMRHPSFLPERHIRFRW